MLVSNRSLIWKLTSLACRRGFLSTMILRLLALPIATAKNLAAPAPPRTGFCEKRKFATARTTLEGAIAEAQRTNNGPASFTRCGRLKVDARLGLFGEGPFVPCACPICMQRHAERIRFALSPPIQ
eukprot:779507-Pleurochrysis_carterae.AAC.3